MFTGAQFVPVTIYAYVGTYLIPEGSARFSWYLLGGVPQFVVDGILVVSGGIARGSMIDAYRPVLESRLLEPSPLILKASWRSEGGGITVTADVEVESALTSSNRQVVFFVCQENLGGYSNLVVDILGPEPFTLTVPGETATIQRQFYLGAGWTLDALRVVVAVQDLLTKEVLQARLAGRAELSAVPEGRERNAMVLHAARPNPFGPSTTVGFSLPRAGHVRLEVFDPAGRLVRVLVDGELDAGDHRAVWRGDDGAGALLPSGAYFTRLQAGAGEIRIGRVLLLR